MTKDQHYKICKKYYHKKFKLAVILLKTYDRFKEVYDVPNSYTTLDGRYSLYDEDLSNAIKRVEPTSVGYDLELAIYNTLKDMTFEQRMVLFFAMSELNLDEKTMDCLTDKLSANTYLSDNRIQQMYDKYDKYNLYHTRICRNWQDLLHLKSSKGNSIVVDLDTCCGYVFSKSDSYLEYLNTHTFYTEDSCRLATKHLQEYGFNVELKHK